MSNVATRTARPSAPATEVNWTNQPDLLAGFRRWQELKAIETAGKEAEKERKALEAELLRPALGEARKVIVRGVTLFSVVASSNSGIDKDALKEAFPEAYAATLKSTPYTYFKAL